MIRKISIIVIAIFLVLLAIFEYNYVEKNMQNLKANVDEVYNIIVIEENSHYLELTPLVDNMLNSWSKIENNLCMMFNHKDLSHINENLIKLNEYILSDNKEEVLIQIKILKNNTDNYKHIMSYNYNNIF